MIMNAKIRLISILTMMSNLTMALQPFDSIPYKNKLILEATTKYGPQISKTYQKAVCTEMLIKILEKITPLSKIEKSRIRIISSDNIFILRFQKSDIPKGVYYALTSSKRGIAIDSIKNVKPGDLVQFWEPTWGHCGIIKSINLKNNTMDLYSSFPSTNGYGIQTFSIPQECYFVRLK